MKKFLAILLAMMLVLVNVAALATGDVEEPTTPGTTEGGEIEGGENEGGETTTNSLKPYLPTEDQKPSIDPTKETYTIVKKINIRDEFTDASTPADTAFAFEVKNGTTTATMPDGSAIDMTKLELPQIANTAVEAGTTSVTLTLTLPEYPNIGIYEYDIIEKSSDFAGMTYAKEDDLKLKITVIQGKEGFEVAGIAIRQEGVKVAELENEYAAGNLKVTKTVSGQLGDLTKKFPIKIELEADRNVGSISTYTYNDTEMTVNWNGGKTATVEVELASGESIEIKNLPEGVTYKVTEGEAIKRIEDATEQDTNPQAYKVGGEVKDATDITVSDTAKVEITNEKDLVIDTGIELETLPFVLLMGIALVGVMALRRREDY